MRFINGGEMKRLKGNKDLILTVKDVSLLQLLSSGSLAKSPEGEKNRVKLFLHSFITLSFWQ